MNNMTAAIFPSWIACDLADPDAGRCSGVPVGLTPEAMAVLAGFEAHWQKLVPSSDNNYTDWYSDALGYVREWSNEWTNQWCYDVERTDDEKILYSSAGYETAEECKRAAEKAFRTALRDFRKVLINAESD